MAWRDDLDVMADYASFKNARAVGWMPPERALPTGRVRAEFKDRLRALCEATLTTGYEATRCPRCEHRAYDPTLVVPARDATYVASPLLQHLILAHRYAPPAAFVRAVMKCPMPSSASYERLLDAQRLEPAAPRPPPPSESLDLVRRRPGLYLGSTDARGLEAMLWEAAGNALDVAQAGRALVVTVGVDAHEVVTVEDDGDGLPLEGTIGGAPAFDAIFLRLHATATLDGHEPHIHVRQLYGAGIAVVQALSARFEVETVRHGELYRAVFERGALTSPLTCLGETARRGTRISWRPDPEIFGAAKHDLAALELAMTELGYLLPTVDLRWQGRSVQRKGGLSEWVAQLAPDAVTGTALAVDDTVFDVRVQAAIAWEARRTTPALRTFVNSVETTLGGAHVKGLLDALSRTAPSPDLARRARDGLVGFVHVWMLHPRFGGPTKALLDGHTPRIAVRDVVRAALRATPPWWDAVLEHSGSANGGAGELRKGRRRAAR